MVLAKANDDDHNLWSRKLDVFKGLAAVAMVVNHSGYALLTAADSNTGWLGFIVFLGSFAPALFFFATGYGTGLATSDKPIDWVSTWTRFVWLMLADQLLLWSGGHRWGMDFFGFIAISVLALAAIQCHRYSSVFCISLIVLLLSLRYLLQSMVEGVAGESALIVWITGVRGQPGFSYPLSPWLVAPLAGFCCARNMSRVTRHWRTFLSAAVVLLSCMLLAVLYERGASFFRWGSVSAAYFVAGATAITIVWALAGGLVSFGIELATRLSLRGAAVFLVVPIHYAALAIMKDLNFQDLTTSNWIFAAAAVVSVTVLALLLARQLADKLKIFREQVTGLATTICLCLVIVLAWWLPAFTLSNALVCAIGQCLIAARLTR
jgi:uncharacterized membrane protein